MKKELVMLFALSVGIGSFTKSYGQVKARILAEVAGDYNTIEFSKDGKYILGGSYVATDAGMTGETVVFNTTTEGFELQKKNRVTLCATFKPDSKEIIMSEMPDGLMSLSFPDGKEKAVPIPKNGYAWCMTYSDDGSNIIIGTTKGEVHVIEVATGKLLRTITINDQKIILSVHVVNNGKTLITNYGTIQYWDLATGKELKVLTPPNGKEVNFIAVSANKKTMISADNTGVTVWDVDKMESKLFFATEPEVCGAVSNDGSLIALGSNGGVHTFNKEGKVIRGWGGKNVNVKAVAFSADDKQCAIGCAYGRIVLFSSAELAVPSQ